MKSLNENNPSSKEVGQSSNEKNREKKASLAEREELLLMKYYEGEASWRESKKARGLLSCSHAARAFIGDLCAQSKAVNDWAKENSFECDLWSQVLSRIEEEERSAVLLGKRSVEIKSSARRWKLPRNLGNIIELGLVAERVVPWFGRLGWGISGALVTASVGIAYLRPPVMGVVAQNDVPVRMMEEVAPAAQVVSFDGEDSSFPSLSPLEVEWMHTDGQLRVIQGPSQRSTIIWVKKKAPRPSMLRTPQVPSQAFVSAPLQ